MDPSLMAWQKEEELSVVYQQICAGYHSIEDFRARLLGLLPFVTGSSFILTIISDPTKNIKLQNLVLPFGILGAIISLGYLCYEVQNIYRMEELRARGAVLEKHMNIANGFFAPLLVSPFSNFFTDIHAAGFIYCTTIAGWICIALWFVLPGSAIIVATVVLLLMLAIVLPLLISVRQRARME